MRWCDGCLSCRWWRRLPAARRLRFWWGLSKFERFEEVIEIRFVLVHLVAIFQRGDVSRYCGTNVVYCVGSCG
jgi:hypothetical protein